MSRLTRGSTGRQGGFTLVELLVTIIIAGIAFAALVPLFVSAQQVTAADQLRNIALQLAQDKIEKVRALDYDSITKENLESRYGTQVQRSTGGGSRTFQIEYSVVVLQPGSSSPVPSPGTTLYEYKQVTVTVRWSPPPSPVKPAVLSTMVSKQYSGPEIVRFDLGPETVLDYDQNGNTLISGGPVVIDVWLDGEDVQSMNQSAADESKRGYVRFTISGLTGNYSRSAKVTSPVSFSESERAHYQYTWENSTAPDDTYLFSAVAVSSAGVQGPPVSIALRLARAAPPQVDKPTATAGNGRVLLEWPAAAPGDLQRYDVQRSADGGQTWTDLAWPPDRLQPWFLDETVVNGTSYQYRVRAVDGRGLAGDWSAWSDPVTPGPQADTNPPGKPQQLSAVAVPEAQEVRLTWQAPSDGDLLGYIVERRTAGGAWVALALLKGGASTMYSDTTVAWSTTYSYQVKAIDTSLNVGAASQAVTVTSSARPSRTITVSVLADSRYQSVYVWVQDVATLTWYQYNASGALPSPTRPSSGTKIAKGDSLDWKSLPAGAFNVYFFSSSTWNPDARLKVFVADVRTGDKKVTYP
jgi:prepilin-type N-terminal cleavage/methylation domain-containing protein